MTESTQDPGTPRLPNGAGAAAILACGLGALTLAVLAILADHLAAVKALLTFSKAAGPLSGVTTMAVAVWLLSWLVLDSTWKRRELRLWPIFTGLVLIALSFLLMFPPIGDLF